MKKRPWSLAVIIGLGLFFCRGGRADEADEVLLEKGVITVEDVERIRTEVDVEKDSEAEVGYRKGVYVRTQGGKHELHIQFLMQPQFENLDVDDGESESSFRIKRAQLRLFGHVLDPRLKYRMMIQGNTKAGADDIDLRDLWVDWQWKEAFQVKAGQFFVFFDYEDLAPTWALQLVDRSIINSQLGFERDIGVQVHGHLLSDRLQYYLYTMNGEGRNELNNRNDLIYGARVDIHLLGTHQYMLPDLKPSDEPHLAWGSAFLHDTGNASVDTNRLNRFTTDLVFRYKGFSALGLLNWARNEDRDATDFGYLGQAGYFIVPERFEVAGRWAKIERNDALGDELADTREATIGLNYYFNGHQVKLQVDYSWLQNSKSKAGQGEDRVRMQVQLFF